MKICVEINDDSMDEVAEQYLKRVLICAKLDLSRASLIKPHPEEVVYQEMLISALRLVLAHITPPWKEIE